MSQEYLEEHSYLFENDYFGISWGSMSEQEIEEYNLKILVVGEAGVGAYWKQWCCIFTDTGIFHT